MSGEGKMDSLPKIIFGDIAKSLDKSPENYGIWRSCIEVTPDSFHRVGEHRLKLVWGRETGRPSDVRIESSIGAIFSVDEIEQSQRPLFNRCSRK